jgi:putative resolvase
MKAKDVMLKYDICRETLWRWVKLGKINYTKTPSGRYDYHDKVSNIEDNRRVVIYARCSTSDQNDNLDRQIERLKLFASSKGLIVNKIYSEIASALNYNRKEYRKLYANIIANNIKTIIIEYKDRLLRIGFQDFEELCKLHNVNIIVIDYTDDNHNDVIDDTKQIVNDLLYNVLPKQKIKEICKSIK